MSDHMLAAPHDERMREAYARMSGQIALAFAYLAETEAAAAVANHINRFWSRSMRRDLGLMFDRQSLELHPLVRRAWDAIHFPSA
jgi:formate dehydrogenase subunit delta